MSVTQISHFVESRPGHLIRALDVFESLDINVRGFSAGDTGEYDIVRFIVDRPEEALAHLHKKGAAAKASQVICVKLDDKPGELRRVLGIIADHGINIVYCYSLVSTYIAVSVKDIEEAERLLENAPITMVTQEEISNLDYSC